MPYHTVHTVFKIAFYFAGIKTHYWGCAPGFTDASVFAAYDPSTLSSVDSKLNIPPFFKVPLKIFWPKAKQSY